MVHRVWFLCEHPGGFVSLVAEPLPDVEEPRAYIYALNDPDTGVTRYIGKADEPKRRLRAHISEARTGSLQRKNKWIRQILGRGQTPELFILDCVPPSEAAEAEKYWISEYNEAGCDLANLTEGGELPPVRYGEANNKAKLNATKVSDLRKRIRAGEDMGRIALEMGVTKQAVWFAATGRTWKSVATSPVASKPRQRLSDEDVDDIRRQSALGVPNGTLATTYEVAISHISHIIHDRRGAPRRLPRR